jgi:hypothetical protein
MKFLMVSVEIKIKHGKILQVKFYPIFLGNFWLRQTGPRISSMRLVSRNFIARSPEV